MVNVARSSFKEAKDKMKTVIKSCLPFPRLGSFEGDERDTEFRNCFLRVWLCQLRLSRHLGSFWPMPRGFVAGETVTQLIVKA